MTLLRLPALALGWQIAMGFLFIDLKKEPDKIKIIVQKEEPVKEGIYLCNGKQSNGERYAGFVLVVKREHGYILNWQNGLAQSRGYGVVDGDKLAVGWESGGMRGLTIFRILGDRLEGRWSALPKGQGVESLTFKEPLPEE